MVLRQRLRSGKERRPWALWEYVPGVSVTLLKLGNDPTILGNDPILKGSWRATTST